MTDSVSIIVAGRNAEPWIVQALSSALTQSHRCQVIYSDDCSTDCTVARAESVRGVQVVRSPVHVGVCEARNRGAAIATGSYLVFLDADDYLPPDFVRNHLAAMVEGCPFAYGPAKAIGGPRDGRVWKVPPWDKWDRWSYNTVNTSALYARWAFDAAGGWRDAPTMWDHDLALRALRFGTTEPRPSTALLNYRQHPASWSAQLNEKQEELIPVRELIRRRNARLSIASILSGRVVPLFPDWMQRIAQAVRFAGLESKPDLLLAVDPRAWRQVLPLRSVAQVWQNSFASIEWVELPSMSKWTDETGRRDAVASWLATSFDKLRHQCRGDILWTVEDDILCPMNACRDLWETTTAGVRPPELVAAAYRSRHTPNLIAGNIERTRAGIVYREYTELPASPEPIPVDLVGTGCSMIWKERPAIPRDWPSHANGKVPAHDWAMAIETKRKGGTVLWDHRVRCGHAKTSADILWP